MDSAGKKSAEPLAQGTYMSIVKTAAELGCSRQGVLIHIAKGELRSETVDDRVVVVRESVTALKAAKEAALSAGV